MVAPRYRDGIVSTAVARNLLTFAWVRYPLRVCIEYLPAMCEAPLQTGLATYMHTTYEGTVQ